GIESQRRDSSPLLGKLMQGVLTHLFPLTKSNNPFLVNDIITPEEREGYIQHAVQYVKRMIQRMLQDELDYGEFILTRGLWLGTQTEDYKAKQEHVELVERIRKRQPWREFTDGERIPYVYIQTALSARGHEKSEDPVYALENDVPLDYQHYLHHQLENQLARLFELLLPPNQVTSLFYGEHTRYASSRVSSKPKGEQTYA
ncbi:DNA-directed DNA polymerase delta, partial [Quaeritorhiza haematococci]